MRSEILTGEQRMQLISMLAELEFFWRYESRVQLLKEANMTRLMPFIDLNDTPQHCAFSVVNAIADRRDAGAIIDLGVAIAAHPNP